MWFLFFQSLQRELACAGIVKIPSKSAASPLECLTDNSGDVSRSIYSNLCLDRKNGYQHTCPHLDADSLGLAERPPAPPGAMTDAPSPPLPFLIAFSFIPRGIWHIELLHISSELTFSQALKIKQYFRFLIFFFLPKRQKLEGTWVLEMELSLFFRLTYYNHIFLLYISPFPKCAPHPVGLREWMRKTFCEVLLFVQLYLNRMYTP